MIKRKTPVKSGLSSSKKKPGPGRPRLGEGKRGTQSPFIGLRLAPSELDNVDNLAAVEGVKRSEMVRRLLLAGISAYRPGKASKS
jgi:hypothetical protein